MVSTIRRAILVAFVGTSLLVLAPVVAVISQPKLSSLASALLGFQSSDRYAKATARAALVVRTVQGEIVVVTLSGMAWALAGMVKSKV